MVEDKERSWSCVMVFLDDEGLYSSGIVEGRWLSIAGWEEDPVVLIAPSSELVE